MKGGCCTIKPIHDRIQATRKVIHVAFVLPTTTHATHKALLLHEKYDGNLGFFKVITREFEVATQLRNLSCLYRKDGETSSSPLNTLSVDCVELCVFDHSA